MKLSDDLPPVGKLSETPAYAIFLWAAQQSFTGRLIFERDERVKHFYLKVGALVGSRSNLVPEGIDVILRRGFVPPADLLSIQNLKESSSRGEDWDSGIVNRLKGGSLMKAEDLRVALAVQLRERVMSLLGWFDGKYAVQPGAPPPASLPVPPPLPLLALFTELEAFLLSGKVPENGACPEFHQPIQGTLRIAGGVSVFVSLALQGASGKLLFERGQRRKLFEIERGTILSAASSDPGETLADVLRRWHYLREDIIAKLESTARAKGTKFRDLLRQEKLLSETEIGSAVMISHAERILEAFSWRSGQYEFRGNFVKDAAQELRFSGAGEVDTTTVIQEEDLTEKEIVLVPDGLAATGGSLSKLFGPAPNNALLLIEVDGSASMSAEVKSLAAAWNHLEGIRTLLILVGPDGADEASPALWSSPGEYTKWVVESEKNTGVGLLSLGPEDKQWRSSDGILAFRRFATYVSSKYDRVLWLASPPSPGSPLLTSVGQIVFVVSKGSTEKGRLTGLIRDTAGAQPAGFLFRSPPEDGTWNFLRERFVLRLDRWLHRS